MINIVTTVLPLFTSGGVKWWGTLMLMFKLASLTGVRQFPTVEHEGTHNSTSEKRCRVSGENPKVSRLTLQNWRTHHG